MSFNLVVLDQNVQSNQNAPEHDAQTQKFTKKMQTFFYKLMGLFNFLK